MTYLHAMQYLFGKGTAKDLSAPSPRAASRESSGAYTEFLAALGSTEPKFYCCLFTADRAGLLCAAYCRSALMAAGISVGEVLDSSMSKPEEALRINGAPVLPTAVRELCHQARALEQKLLRARSSPQKEGDHTPPPVPEAFSATERCGAVLPRLFADAGCRVLLLIGQISDPRIRALANRSPASTIAVLSAGEHKPLQSFPNGTTEVICPTCSSEVFHRVTDACARAGSRLSVIASSQVERHLPSLFSQTFSYRSLTDCTLRCGSQVALRYALLAAEALFSLARLGCRIAEDAMREGFAAVSFPCFFAPISIRPLLITHALHDPDDVDALMLTLEEFSSVMPAPPKFLCVDEASAALIERATGATPLTLPDPDAAAATLRAATEDDVYLLLGGADNLQALICRWQSSLRRL